MEEREPPISNLHPYVNLSENMAYGAIIISTSPSFVSIMSQETIHITILHYCITVFCWGFLITNYVNDSIYGRRYRRQFFAIFLSITPHPGVSEIP